MNYREVKFIRRLQLEIINDTDTPYTSIFGYLSSRFKIRYIMQRFAKTDFFLYLDSI